MGTTATPTKTGGPNVKRGIGVEYEFTLLFDTTDASGLMTIDLTSYFSYLGTCTITGSLAATGYVCEIQKVDKGTALTSTNLIIGVYEAGADAAPLDPVASTDVSAVVTGLTIVATGKDVIATSWA